MTQIRAGATLLHNRFGATFKVHSTQGVKRMENRTRLAAVFVTIAAALLAAPSVSQEHATAPAVAAQSAGPLLGLPSAGSQAALAATPSAERPATKRQAGFLMALPAPPHKGIFAAKESTVPVAFVSGPALTQRPPGEDRGTVRR